MPLKIVFFEALKSLSTKTLLFKHYCRCQGNRFAGGVLRFFPLYCAMLEKMRGVPA